jgi:hypothetical protein
MPQEPQKPHRRSGHRAPFPPSPRHYSRTSRGSTDLLTGSPTTSHASSTTRPTRCSTTTTRNAAASRRPSAALANGATTALPIRPINHQACRLSAKTRHRDPAESDTSLAPARARLRRVLPRRKCLVAIEPGSVLTDEMEPFRSRSGASTLPVVSRDLREALSQAFLDLSARK